MSDEETIDVGKFFRTLEKPKAEGSEKVLPFDKPQPHAGDAGSPAGIDYERQELAKKSDPMPETPQEPYRPHAGFLNRLQAEQRTFYVVFADCTNRGFPYAHYDGIRLERAGEAGGGLVLVVRFNGSETEEVWITGQSLRFIEVCIGMGIMPWIWELPPGQRVKGDGETVITRVTIKKIKRE
jgi:hypothetical protein